MDKLNELNKKIEAEVLEGRISLFRVALASKYLTDDESFRKELKESVWELPYLRIAYLFRDFYNNSDGRNYLSLWKEGNCNKVDLPSIWKLVFGRDVNQYEVKAKGWILFGECRGKTSDIWRAIKTCAAKKSEDGADRFDALSYANDEVPKQLRLILDDYQSGGISGAEFVSFIEAFTRKEGSADSWMESLVNRAIEHFPSSIDFTAAGYLHWDGQSSTRADLILGIDHVRRVLSGRLRINDSVSTINITTGFRSIALLATNLPSYNVRFMGVKECISSSLKGVYYRYQPNDSSRRSWWIKVRYDGTFPYKRDEILVVFDDDAKGSFALGEGFLTDEIQETRVYCAGQRYLFVSARIKERPKSACRVMIGDQSISFAGMAPLIRVGTATAQSIWADDAVVVDMPTRIEVANIADGMSCRWSINGNEVPCSDTSLNLPSPKSGIGESRVKATISKDGRICQRLSINIFHIPAEIARHIREGDKLPQGWSLEEAKDRKDCIALRVAGRCAKLLKGSNNVERQVLVEDHSCAWWIEKDMVQDLAEESFKKVSCFTRISELEEAYLCLPSDLEDAHLTVDEKDFPVNKWPPKDGVIRIPLEYIVGGSGDREFRYAGNVPELQFKLDGQLVGVVAAVPKAPTLCRQAGTDELGVFLPKRTRAWPEKFLVLAYRDTPTDSEIYKIPEMLTPEMIEWKRDTGDQFVSIASALSDYLNIHSRGDVFVVLVNESHWNEYSCILANPFFLKADSKCQILLVRKELDLYSEDELRVTRQLKSAWGEDFVALPQGHPLKKLRIATFEGAMHYDECLSYWHGVSGEPSMWKTAFRVMLDSGFNPLMEPDWFNQSVDQLIENVQKRREYKRATKGRKKEVLKVLLDNRDVKSDSFIQGEGLCAALVSRRQILRFAPFVPAEKEAYFKNRELTMLDSLQISKFGFYGVFASNTDNRDIRHSLSSAKNGKLVFSGSGSNVQERLEYDGGEWMRTDERTRLLSLQAIALSAADSNPQIFEMMTSDIVEKERDWTKHHCSSEEYSQLVNLGIRMSNSLSQEWTRELFAGTFEALHKKGCCDTAVVRVLGLVICLQSVLADKDKNCELGLKADSPDYKLALRLTMSLFNRKYLDDDDILWREMMRFITKYLWLHTYLDIPTPI